MCDKAGGRFHHPGRSHRGEHGAVIQRRKDAVHLVGHFPKPADVRTNSASALAARNLRRRLVTGVIGERRPPAGVAAALEKLPVHWQNVGASGWFLKVSQFLRAEEQAVREPALQFGEREMRGVGLGGGGNAPAHGIEFPDQRRIARPRIRRRHFFDAIVSPQSTHPAKGGDATLSADAGSGKNENLVLSSDVNHELSIRAEENYSFFSVILWKQVVMKRRVRR